MDNIKIIRLEDGEDIIASYEIEEETNTIIMNNPMTLFFKRVTPGKSFVMMSPWMPAELVKINMAKIHAHRIVSIFEPKSSLIEYYLSAVDECNEVIKMNEKLIDHSLSEQSQADDSDNEDEEEIEIKETSKGHTLH